MEPDDDSPEITEQDEKVIDRIADRVFSKLRHGLMSLPPETVEDLKKFGGYVNPPVTVGYGPDYYTFNSQVNKDGSIYLQLRDCAGNNIWQGMLTT